MLALLWLAAKLPIQTALRVGKQLGRLMARISRRRRRISLRNVQLCMPELRPDEREALMRRNFEFMGRAGSEAALAWFGDERVDQIPCEVKGIEHLHAAQADSRAVILLSGHFLCVELAARLIGKYVDMGVIYKPLKRKPLMDRAMLRSRRRTLVEALPKDDLRGIIRALKKGIPLWYAGDQHYGGPGSVTVPFMGVPAATVTGLTKLARMTNSRVVPIFFNAKEQGLGYEVTFQPALDGFPTRSELLDAQWMNGVIERAIRKHPEQYFWVHRRFKHPPSGERPYYEKVLQKRRDRL